MRSFFVCVYLCVCLSVVIKWSGDRGVCVCQLFNVLMMEVCVSVVINVLMMEVCECVFDN